MADRSSFILRQLPFSSRRSRTAPSVSAMEARSRFTVDALRAFPQGRYSSFCRASRTESSRGRDADPRPAPAAKNRAATSEEFRGSRDCISPSPMANTLS